MLQSNLPAKMVWRN